MEGFFNEASGYLAKLGNTPFDPLGSRVIGGFSAAVLGFKGLGIGL